jgi:bifunctional UDP-N-acetylglucosamine pyrophosphorylase / glucosamine-1-phosphate N-acetyltransferase
MPTATPQSEAALPEAIILAAGQGKRMGGDRPKVLLEVAGRPMVWWVVQACRAAGVRRCVLVIGHKGELVRQAMASLDGGRDCGERVECVYVEQHERLGTGHAVRMAEPLYRDQPPRDLFVLAGDGPLIRARTLGQVLQAHRRQAAAATLATAVLDDPTGYGRIVRDAAGRFETIVEQKDATAAQRAIREVNPSYWCFRSDALFEALEQVGNDNRQGEYYLTDVPAILRGRGRHVAVVEAVPPEDVLSINTPEQLAQVDALLRRRLEREAAGRSRGPRGVGNAV